ncbi:hypothetical protein EDD99_5073 [Streptomyces sp. 846.5]|nr:GNAT family N-acetyltransferase [Streptomyces sp. 846.5]TDU06514.1 hypothetical protein EDD99_5073 [Streptomyces sp. 846.5]
MSEKLGQTRIVRLADPSDAELAGWQQVRTAGADDSGAGSESDAPGPSASVVRLLAWDGDTAVGLAWVRLHRADGRRQTADCRISVLGDGYGQGVAAALLDEVVALAVAEGRSELLTSTPVGSAGEEFLVGAGFALRANFCRLRLRVADCDQDALRATVKAASDGYSLVRWQGVPPSDLIGPFAATREAMNDTPADAPDHLVWDEDRVRANARSAADRGQNLLTVAALGLDEEGAEVVAGFSEIVLDGGGSGRARQSDTIVLRGHRGRGLGLWVKAAMLEWLIGAHPEVEEVLTACLVSNTHMIAINEQIGFQAIQGERHYRLAL